MPEAAVQQYPIDKLKPFDRNPREHPEEQLELLAKQITQFGWTSPLIVDENDVILAGHGRLVVAKMLRDQGVKIRDWRDNNKILIRRLKGLTRSQKTQFVLADNQLPLMAEWNDNLLGNLLSELEEVEIDLTDMGFSEEELDNLLADVDEPDETVTPQKKKKRKATEQSPPEDDAPIAVIIECDSEDQQLQLIDRFLEEGLKCRALM